MTVILCCTRCRSRWLATVPACKVFRSAHVVSSETIYSESKSLAVCLDCGAIHRLETDMDGVRELHLLRK